MDTPADANNAPFVLGWEEWLALPDLGLHAMKAKVDTGAKTSALHATNIESFGTKAKQRVRFVVHPDPSNDKTEVICSADVVGQKEVTSSNGESELRYVIRTHVQFGERAWPIDITLTDRKNMAYRMLLGRQAFPDGTIVNPAEGFNQPELSYDLYKKRAPATAKRPLRIAILTREPNNYSTRRIIEEAENRDHVIEIIDTTRCYMNIRTVEPEVHYDGKVLPRYDAVIPRIGASITSYGTSVVRQFETIGTYCVNGSWGISASRDKLHAHQILARHQIGMPTTAFASSPKDTKNLIGMAGKAPLIVKLLESTQGKGVVLAETQKAAESVISAFRGLKAEFLVQQFVKEAAGEDIRCLVVGGKVVAAMRRKAAEGEFRSNLHQGGVAEAVKITRKERETALKAARAMNLNFAGVDLLRSADGPMVLEINSSPGLEGVEKATKRNVAGKVMDHIERRVRPSTARKST
ncbi:30S ribosomal protein S6--L-glutamate ligase [Amylibacter sp. IMCC11727]|uniref:30S ribosomal protein S6--L-glutamate ligase n=1 Tax=Amylibacter sp. IMCC11727 TaxID=3039851 RepID=UPI00244E21FB|nr:30S ribosomal protein S6--L-glutamate ligase [Amylibacter sp. IMCC11727]WGI20671.1 30S ribosomal protein S6--L-glutamate ligase [Amylibacter sp. IMCC11727]